MELHALCTKFSDTPEHQQKAIFHSLFILSNRLQTLFDQRIPEVTLKQFLLLALVRQSKEPLPLTQLGALLGCSRQNVKKLAAALARKGFVTIDQSPIDPRALWVCPTEKVEQFFAQDFAQSHRALPTLFSVYSESELASLFQLLMKLYAGLERLETITQEDL